MGNKKISVFGTMLARIKDMRYVGISRSYLLNDKRWGRNAETFYASNLIKLGYLKESETNSRTCITYYLAKEIPEDYNSSSLRKEMKEKNLKKI